MCKRAQKIRTSTKRSSRSLSPDSLSSARSRSETRTPGSSIAFPRFATRPFGNLLLALFGHSNAILRGHLEMLCFVLQVNTGIVRPESKRSEIFWDFSWTFNTSRFSGYDPYDLQDHQPSAMVAAYERVIDYAVDHYVQLSRYNTGLEMLVLRYYKVWISG